MSSPTRKLAAIMFTDIVGYTAIMAKDEQKALQLLNKNRKILKSLIKQYNGEWLKEMGDGTLSCFQSAVDAVNCSLEIQSELINDTDLTLRIGIHIGDVVFTEGDVFGDGVNVASRIEPLATPGGVCVTEPVYDAIRNKPDIGTIPLGEKTLKNVNRPIKVYALTGEWITTPTIDISQIPDKVEKRDLSWIKWIAVAAVVVISVIIFNKAVKEDVEPPVEKSIAVLPFTTFSENQEDLFFTDGVHDDILTQLSKIHDLKVISRTSVVQYKNTTKTMGEIAKELDVVNILEGSVR